MKQECVEICAGQQKHISRFSVLLIGAVSLGLVPDSGFSQDFLEETFLLDVSIGSSRSQIASELSLGGYELADGTPVDFHDWYTPRFEDLNFRFLTEITPSFGLIWGFSFGERGVKYRINPGLWLGFVYRVDFSRRSRMVFSAVTMAGGNFRELACLGDYAEIGGIQSVNCRLAASHLPPADTLLFLVKERGLRETRLSVRYVLNF